MPTAAKITGTGMYVPDRVVTNDDLAKLMDTSDEWIRQRSGIGERRYIEPGPRRVAPRARGGGPRGRRDRLRRARDALAAGRLPRHLVLPPGGARRRRDPVLRPARAVQRLRLLARGRERPDPLRAVPAHA